MKANSKQFTFVEKRAEMNEGFLLLMEWVLSL